MTTTILFSLAFLTLHFCLQHGVQNTLAQAVFPSTQRYDHITPILCELHWLLIKECITFKISSLTFQTLAQSSPSYLRDLLIISPTRSLRSSDHHRLTIPHIDSANGRRSFAYAAPSVWNSLPLNIHTLDSYQSFRSALKTHLFPP